jgi:hypothetical protein
MGAKREGETLMKRITLTLAVAGALLVPAALLTGSAGAANPHGDKGDPSASCGNGNRPCDDPNLPQSEGCLHGQAPVQNPHCQPGTSGIVPSTPVSNPPTGTSPSPGQSAPANKPGQGVAGAEAGKQAGNPGTAAAVNSAKTIDELPFTGLETLWLALIGGGMLTLGLVLRVRSSSPSETRASTDSPVSGGEARNWDVPELGMAPRMRPGYVQLPFSEYDALGRVLIGNGQARRAGSSDTLVVPLD